jgi:hypothetical protein
MRRHLCAADVDAVGVSATGVRRRVWRCLLALTAGLAACPDWERTHAAPFKHLAPSDTLGRSRAALG